MYESRSADLLSSLRRQAHDLAAALVDGLNLTLRAAELRRLFVRHHRFGCTNLSVLARLRSAMPDADDLFQTCRRLGADRPMQRA